MKFLALFRGINVSGQKIIKMKDLQKLLEGSGFKNVLTYIQSGNVIFESKEISAEKIVKKMQTAIKEKYGFHVEILVTDANYLKSVISKNPYPKRKDFDQKKMYISFLNEKPVKENLGKLNEIKSGDDEWFYHDRQIYFYCPGGYGNTKFNNNAIEKKLKLTATTRNWNTVNTLFEMLAG